MSHILVIDDDPLVRQIVSHSLRRLHLEVQAAENGRRGVEVARAAAPALILCDVRMEDGDGFTALADLKDDPLTQAIPLILMSAQAHPAAQAKARDLGACAFLAKPFSVTQLLDLVTAHLPAR